MIKKFITSGLISLVVVLGILSIIGSFEGNPLLMILGTLVMLGLGAAAILNMNKKF